jgi:peptidoglycan/LPS O-acetylase OafA/YrhL
MVFVLAQSPVRSEVNEPYNLSDLLWIWRHPIAHMWFLYALFFARIACYAVALYFGATGLKVAAILWMILYLAGEHGRWLDHLAPELTSGGAFLMLGCVTAVWLRKPISRAPAVLAAVAAGVIWVMANIYMWRGSAVGWPQLAALAGVTMTIAACLLLRNWRGLGAALLAQIGQASLAIFVAHVIFAAGLRILLYRYGVYDCTLHVIAGTLVGTLIPTALFVAANRMKIAPLAGFGRTQKFLYVAPHPKAA